MGLRLLLSKDMAPLQVYRGPYQTTCTVRDRNDTADADVNSIVLLVIQDKGDICIYVVAAAIARIRVYLTCWVWLLLDLQSGLTRLSPVSFLWLSSHSVIDVTYTHQNANIDDMFSTKILWFLGCLVKPKSWVIPGSTGIYRFQGLGVADTQQILSG